MDQKEINVIVERYYEDLFEDGFDIMMEKLRTCRLVGLDFDGTVTVKGQVLVREDGKEYIVRSRKDSLLIPVLNKAGMVFAVISTEENLVVKINCAKMKIECFQGVQTGESKLNIFLRKAKELGLMKKELVFMGDDINDIPCLEWATVPFCPADSHYVVQEVVKRQKGIVLTAEGGNGALRQLTELLLLAKGMDIKR